MTPGDGGGRPLPFSRNDVIILAGGLGKRMGGLVRDLPKPMLPVSGRPFLEWVLLRLRALGFGTFILSVGYRRGAVAAHFEDGARWGVSVRYSEEESPLGTAGAIRRAAAGARGADLLVVNGDSLCMCDAGEFHRCHARRGAEVTLCCVRVPDASRYGSVRADGEGRVAAFEEKAAGAGWINAGMYWMRRRFAEGIVGAAPLSLERDVLPGLCDGRLYAYRAEAGFIDMGTPDALPRAGDFVRRSGLGGTAGGEGGGR